jgi:hypothetical protein
MNWKGSGAISLARSCFTFKECIAKPSTIELYYPLTRIKEWRCSIVRWVRNKFAIFAVEIDDMGDLKVTLMLAGQHGVPMQAGTSSWNGVSYPSLKAGILNARAAVWFV